MDYAVILRGSEVGGARGRFLLARVGENCPFGSLRSPQRALPTETKVESVTSQSKRGTSVNLLEILLT